MKKERIISVVGLLAVLFLLDNSYAELIDRGGGLIYDSGLNITWLQDANYAKTSGYHPTGEMTWFEAMTWSENLVYGGYDDWRLPTLTPVNGVAFNFSEDFFGGSTDIGYNISAPGSTYPNSTASELAYMYHIILKVINNLT